MHKLIYDIMSAKIPLNKFAYYTHFCDSQKVVKDK